MDITSAQYTQYKSGENSGVKIVVDGETIHVPIDNANRHYQAILDWVAEGNTIADAD